MVKRKISLPIAITKITFWLFALVLFSGFQTIPGPKWKIDRDQHRTLWILPGESFLNLQYPEDEEIPEDIAFGNLEAPNQAIAILKFIIAQYNSISTTYVRLQLTPMEGIDLGEPNPGDIEWTQEVAEGRTIKVAEGKTHAVGGGGGEARMEFNEQRELSGCTVVVSGDFQIRGFVTTVAHEIGHCLGLAHAHDDRQSIMGYGGAASGVYKLGMDDKMGITYLYPLKEEYGKEAMTLGLSCSRSK